jgi:hypothetical protein
MVSVDVSAVCISRDRPLHRMQLTPDLEITRRIDEAKQKMGRVMQIAAFSLAEVTYAVGGDIGYQVQESAKQARFRVRTKQENVSGVLLPHFESYTEDSINDFGLTGLGKGGQQVQRCRETYARAVETLVELASLQVRASSTHCMLLADCVEDCLCNSRRSHQGCQPKRYVTSPPIAPYMLTSGSECNVRPHVIRLYISDN